MEVTTPSASGNVVSPEVRGVTPSPSCRNRGPMKSTPRKPALETRETRLAVRNSRLPSRRRSSNGSCLHSSVTMNAARRSRPPRALPTTVAELHPRVGPSLRAYRASASPMPARRKPGRSKRPAVGSRCSCRKTRPNRKAAIPMGTFTKNTQRHDNWSTSRPPSTGPVAGAITVGTMRTLEICTRCAGGNVR